MSMSQLRKCVLVISECSVTYLLGLTALGGAAPFTISFCYLCLMLYDGRVLFGSSPVDFTYEVRRTILYL